MALSRSFVFQYLCNTSACGLRETAMSEDPHIRLPMLDDVTSGLTGNPLRPKIYTYTHPDKNSTREQ